MRGYYYRLRVNEVNKSTEPERGAVASLFLYGGLTVTGILLSQFAFTDAIRERILQRDNYTCVDQDDECLGGIIASHINHDKHNRNYNSETNGVARCHYHEMMYHIDSEGHNGLNKKQNMDAIRGNAGMIGLLGMVGEIIRKRKYG